MRSLSMPNCCRMRADSPSRSSAMAISRCSTPTYSSFRRSASAFAVSSILTIRGVVYTCTTSYASFGDRASASATRWFSARTSTPMASRMRPARPSLCWSNASRTCSTSHCECRCCRTISCDAASTSCACCVNRSCLIMFVHSPAPLPGSLVCSVAGPFARDYPVCSDRPRAISPPRRPWRRFRKRRSPLLPRRGESQVPHPLELPPQRLHLALHLAHPLAHPQDHVDPREVHPQVVHQPLHLPQPRDVRLRVHADVSPRALWLHEPDALVLPQRLRVHADHPRRDRDHVARLIEADLEAFVSVHLVASHRRDLSPSVVRASRRRQAPAARSSSNSFFWRSLSRSGRRRRTRAYRSPLPSRPSRGMPRPASLNTRPFCVSGGIFSITLAVIVGTSTSPPSAAVATGTSMSSWRSSPLRSKRACGRTVTTSSRSPFCPPMPAWPSPAMRTLEPFVTPAGIFTSSRRGRCTKPAPWQVWHVAPAISPAPPHVGQGSVATISSMRVVPWYASSRLTSTGCWMSAPRRAVRVPVPPPRRKNVLNTPPRSPISPRSERSNSWYVAPP